MAAFLFILFTAAHLNFAAASKPTGFSLRLIPRDSLESPLYPGNLTQLERIERMLNFSNARAKYFNLEPNSTTNGTDLDPDTIQFPVLRDAFMFFVQVGIGSNRMPVYILMDTGSGLVWTQCEPCISCYPMRVPIFDSRSSSSYRTIPCNHPLCRFCQNGVCVYRVVYGGGGRTQGVLAFESFQFQTGPIQTAVLDNIVFGCSNDNINDPFKEQGTISGVLGLSLSPFSLVQQLSDVVHRRFSYCLPPFIEAQQSPSILRFGEDIPIRPNLQTTPFVTPRGKTLYYLNLLDISVGTRRLFLPHEAFQVKGDGSSGCVIDSGTLITRITTTTVRRINPFNVVMREFQRYYDDLRLERQSGRVPEGFDLCYRTPRGFENFVSLTYHFYEADYVVEGRLAHFINTERGYFCVPLGPGNGKTWLGVWHQQNKRIIYDANFMGLQFVSENCVDDHY